MIISSLNIIVSANFADSYLGSAQAAEVLPL
jgi:hypothetical protein